MADVRIARLAAERRRLLPLWKALLKSRGGNIARAGRMAVDMHDGDDFLGFTPGMDPDMARDRAQRLTGRLGLVAYAEQLRRASGGARTGRPRKEETRP